MARQNREPGTTSIALFILGLLSIALIVHEVYGEHGVMALRRQKRELQTLQQQLKHLQEENKELENKIKALQSDPHAIEKVAREEMHLARPGEIIYSLPEKQDKTESKSNSKNPSQP